MDTMIDVILPAWRNPELTWRCITHLFAAPSGWEDLHLIYVNDDCPEPETDLIGQYMQLQGHEYVRNRVNLGCHGSWNAGLVHAASPRVLFINNDVAVSPGCIARMLDLKQQTGYEYIAATEVVVGEGGEGFIARMASTLSQFQLPVSKLGGYFNSCFLVDRSVFAKTGPFDASFRIEYGDVDWLHRFWDAGFRSTICEGAFALHTQSASRRTNRRIEDDVALCMADQQRFYEKWTDRQDVLAAHPWETAEQKIAGRQKYWRPLGCFEGAHHP